MNRTIVVLARVISIVGHPFVSILILVGVVAGIRMGPAGALQPLGIVALAVLLPLGIFMYRRVRSGRWGSIDASLAAERPALFLLALALVVGLGAFVALSPRLGFLSRGIVSVLLLLSVAAFLNRWIKASLHVAFAAYSGTVLLRLALPVGLAVLAFLPALAWARLAMQRHTFPEICAGCAIGAAVGVLTLMA